MERVLRKKRSELVFSGIGAILLVICVFIKVILMILFAADYVQRAFGFDSFDPDMKAAALFPWILIGFGGMLLYLYVGTRAVREGRTGKRQRGYLVLAAVLLVVNVLLFIANLMAFSTSQPEPFVLIG